MKFTVLRQRREDGRLGKVLAAQVSEHEFDAQHPVRRWEE